VLFISQDVLGRSMAGPGIRTYHLSRILAEYMPTVVALPNQVAADAPPNGAEYRSFDLNDWATLAPLVAQSSVVIAQGDIANIFQELGSASAAIVIDGYTPYLAEHLATWRHLPVAAQMPHWQLRLQMLDRQYRTGDFFLCASERQRDWWLGLLEAYGRINPATLHDDPALRRLLDVVPYGLRSEPIQHTRRVIRGVWPGIGDTDKVLLWGGGLWPWLDPLTAIHAVARLWSQRQDIRLIFPGTRHPNPAVENMPTHTAAAKALATELGLTDKAVFFGDWIPYEDWDNVLLESDVALSLHFDTLETRLAFRTRIFDYIRAGVPSIVSAGDVTAEIITRHRLGIVTPVADAGAVAAAMAALLDTPRTTYAADFAAARVHFTWERAAEPLVRFCLEPRRAPDKAALGARLGNPMQVALGEQLAQAHKTIAAYESGKFMRLMRWVDGIKRRLLPASTANGTPNA
jgi:glycosyltransferase involved in cell wall biosynthesis